MKDRLSLIKLALKKRRFVKTFGDPSSRYNSSETLPKLDLV